MTAPRRRELRWHNEARTRQPTCGRIPPPRSRSDRGDFPLPPVLFQALGFVLLFAALITLFTALIALAALGWRYGAGGGVLSMVTAVVGFCLTVRWIP